MLTCQSKVVLQSNLEGSSRGSYVAEDRLREVVLRRLELCLSRLELLNKRIDKLERGLAQLQHRVGRAS